MLYSGERRLPSARLRVQSIPLPGPVSLREGRRASMSGPERMGLAGLSTWSPTRARAGCMPGGRFVRGHQQRLGRVDQFIAMCVWSAGTELFAEATGPSSQGYGYDSPGEAAAAAVGACAMGGLGQVADLAIKARYAGTTGKIIGAFASALLNAAYTAWGNRYAAWEDRDGDGRSDGNSSPPYPSLSPLPPWSR